MAVNEDYLQILITTLQKQIEVLQQIMQITEQQSHIADLADFDEEMFDKTLNQKEMLIARLNELDDGFTAVYARVRNQITENKDSYREQIGILQQLIKQCTELGIEIKVLENRNRDKLAQCFANKQKTYVAKRNAASVTSHYHRTMNNQRAMDAFRFNEKK